MTSGFQEAARAGGDGTHSTYISGALYGWEHVLKVRESREQQLLQVALLGLPQGRAEDFKSLGTPFGQQVEEFHILAKTARFGLGYKKRA